MKKCHSKSDAVKGQTVQETQSTSAQSGMNSPELSSAFESDLGL